MENVTEFDRFFPDMPLPQNRRRRAVLRNLVEAIHSEAKAVRKHTLAVEILNKVLLELRLVNES